MAKEKELTKKERINYIIESMEWINGRHIDDTAVLELKLDNRVDYSADDATELTKIYPNDKDVIMLSAELNGLSDAFRDVVSGLEDWEEMEEDNEGEKDRLWEDFVENCSALEENAGGILITAKKVKAMLDKEKENKEIQQ